jgi:hypothetical protein
MNNAALVVAAGVQSVHPFAAVVNHAVGAVESAVGAVLDGHKVLLGPFVDDGPLVPALAALVLHPKPAVLSWVSHWWLDESILTHLNGVLKTAM